MSTTAMTAPNANRRSMLGLGGAVAAMSVALPGTQGAPIAEPDPHVAWLRRLFEVRFLFDNREPGDPFYDVSSEKDPLWSSTNA